MKMALNIGAALLLALPAAAQAQQWYRCTAPDHSYSFITRKPKCPSPKDQLSMETPQAPVMQRSPQHTGPVKCTAKDGKQTIQMGNCRSQDDAQQPLR